MPAESSASREERVAMIYADCCDRLNAGESLDVERLVAEHPDLAPELPAALRSLGGSDFSLQLSTFLGGLETGEGSSAVPGPECVLAGRYSVRRHLGAGGMGAVFLAHDSKLDRQVAIKVLRRSGSGDRGAVARFEREAKALAKLSHPNIVQAYDSGEEEGSPFLVMEYVEGKSLGDLLRECGRISPGRAADYVYQAALGLEHAHQRGLIHRDLKPSNLLLAPDGRVKLLDLGLARFVQDRLRDPGRTGVGIGMGTPDYMAPEQFRNAREADARSDIYALGCTLYHLLTGCVPFPGTSLEEKSLAHEGQEPPAITALCPDAPAGLVAVVERMMKKRPAARFQTAADLALALAPYVAGSSRSLAFTPGGRKARLGLLPYLAAGGALLTLMAFAAFSRPGAFRDRGTTPTAKLLPPSQDEPGVLTVARDGAGRFRTIREALDAATAGMTVRVLDDASYEESIAIDDPARHGRLVLEAPAHATIVLTGESRRAIAIDGVPGVRVRGFRFREAGASSGSSCVTVTSHLSGVVLEDLEIHGTSEAHGIIVQDPAVAPGEAPLVIQGCIIEAGKDAISVLGPPDAEAAHGPAQGVSIRNNRVTKAVRGIRLRGAVAGVHVTGNILSNCAQAAVQVEDPVRGTARILIACNTVFDSATGFRVWDNEPHETLEAGQVEVLANLFLDIEGSDMLLVRGTRERGPTPAEEDLRELARLWRFERNWRDVAGNRPGYAIPLSPGDTALDKVELESRDPAAPDFLRPRKDSTPAAEAAGAYDPSLPRYVGAVAPEGTPPWDWNTTWRARAGEK